MRTIGIALAFGMMLIASAFTSTAAWAQMPYHCGNPYIGGSECQDQRVGLGAMIVNGLHSTPYGYGGQGYGYQGRRVLIPGFNQRRGRVAEHDTTTYNPGICRATYPDGSYKDFAGLCPGN